MMAADEEQIVSRLERPQRFDRRLRVERPGVADDQARAAGAGAERQTDPRQHELSARVGRTNVPAAARASVSASRRLMNRSRMARQISREDTAWDATRRHRHDC